MDGKPYISATQWAVLESLSAAEHLKALSSGIADGSDALATVFSEEEFASLADLFAAMPDNLEHEFPDDPSTYAEAMASDHAPEWTNTLKDEFNSLCDLGVYKLVPRLSVPHGRKIMRGRPVLRPGTSVEVTRPSGDKIIRHQHLQHVSSPFAFSPTSEQPWTGRSTRSTSRLLFFMGSSNRTRYAICMNPRVSLNPARRTGYGSFRRGCTKRCAKLEYSIYTWRNFRDVPSPCHSVTVTVIKPFLVA
jgi:hypothetical protein